MDSPATVYALSMNWFRQWQSFIRTRTCDPPGPIDNSSIVNPPTQSGQSETVKPGSDYAQISEELWQFFYQIYGGGPEVRLRSSANKTTTVVAPPPQRSQSVAAIPCTYEPPPTMIGASDSVPEFFIPPLRTKKHPTPVFDSSMKFENEYKQAKNIAPVHEPKNNVFSLSDPMDCETEIAINTDTTDTVPDNMQNGYGDHEHHLTAMEQRDSIEDISMNETSETCKAQPEDKAKDPKGKRRIKYKKNKNKQESTEKNMAAAAAVTISDETPLVK